MKRAQHEDCARKHVTFFHLSALCGVLVKIRVKLIASNTVTRKQTHTHTKSCSVIGELIVAEL